MNKEAVIYDLDNTIYPVHTIGESLFAQFFSLISQYPEHTEKMDVIKADMMRRPFQLVAIDHHFSKQLTKRGNQLLTEMTYTGPIRFYNDYPEIKKIPAERYLVTTGFYNLQQSKINGLGIADDFKEIHVVDPLTSNKTKKDVFADIIQRYGYDTTKVLVIGDDPESEIKAALQLGIDTVLYDKFDRYSQHTATYKINDFAELKALIC